MGENARWGREETDALERARGEEGDGEGEGVQRS